jgi:hypothetical protein
MANIDAIDKRIKKLERRDKHSPLIVWDGQNGKKEKTKDH